MNALTWNDIHAISEVLWNVSPFVAIFAYTIIECWVKSDAE